MRTKRFTHPKISSSGNVHEIFAGRKGPGAISRPFGLWVMFSGANHYRDSPKPGYYQDTTEESLTEHPFKQEKRMQT